MGVFIILAATLALAYGDAFLEDGKEYIFQEEGSQIAGTMDYAPHSTGMAWNAKVRMQVHGAEIHVQMSNFKTSMYNGEYHPTHDEWGTKTKFLSYNFPNGDAVFTIKYDHGRIVALVMSSSYTRAQRNMIKAWASNWQIALHDQHSHGDHHHAFTSEEKLLHGDCEMHYTKNENMVTRAVSHMADCKNRKYRLLDNWRGHRCDGEGPMEAFDNNGAIQHGRENPEPIWSNADNFYTIEMKGERYKVVKLSASMSVNAQVFESAGVSHFVFYNRSMTLVEEKVSGGDMHTSGGSQYTDLGFEFVDDQYKWDDDLNMQDAEPFFSAEIEMETDQDKLKGGLKMVLEGIYDNFERHDNSEETVKKMHESGVQMAFRFLVNMNFQTLSDVFRDYKAAQDEKGVTMKNLFTEYLGSTGTRASAMMVKHAVEQKWFDSDGDAARVVTSVAFHIRRPNKKLVDLFNNLSTGYAAEKFTEMALVLARAHLARRTCELAGKMGSPESVKCVEEIVDPLAQNAFDTYIRSNDYETKSLQLTYMHNLRWGMLADLLKPVIYGEVENDDSMRARAIRATGWKVLAKGEGISWYLPVFLDKTNGHETRIEALKMIFDSKPDATTLSTIVSSLYGESNFEVVNFAFSLFEKYSKSINPCNRNQAHQSLAKYFIKYMKQAGFHHTNYGLGISKTWSQEFQKEKYGYGGAYDFHAIGSHKSTTPLTVDMTISSNLYHGYESNMFQVHLRIEGLAKALVRKFTKVKEDVWKLEDLKKILEGMGIQMKTKQKVRVEVLVLVKGTAVWNRLYDENAMKRGGKIAEFLESFTEIGKKKQYSINHQRALVFGESIYEQPTDSGLPMSYLSYLTTMASVKADVGSGTKRGSIEREIKYDINLFTQYTNMMLFGNPETRHTFSIRQDRVYGAHHPRKISLSINLVGKDKNVNLKISRPSFQKPLALLMHSQTDLMIIHKGELGVPTGLQVFCSTCKDVVRLSKGDQTIKSRAYLDNTNKNTGSYAYGEFFGCEMDVAEKKAIGNVAVNFLPFNKNPKSPFALFSMGMRELRAFLLYFPRAEQCGTYFRWSQSEVNPVKELQFKLQAKVTTKGEPMMFREGQLVMLKLTITAVSGEGKTKDRQYKVNFKYVSEAANLDNAVTVAVIRNQNRALGISGYKICAGYNSKYNKWGDEVMAVDVNQNLQVIGKVNFNYGSGKGSCDVLKSKIAIDFTHSSTARSVKEVENTWYYKACEEEKKKPEWRQRVAKGAAPFTEACYKTNFDIAQARLYKWNAKMEGLTPQVKGVIAKAQTIMKAGMIPYWDLDPEALSGSIGDSPTLDLTVEFHDNEKLVDIEMKTIHGTTQWPNLPVPGSISGWTRSLRSLRFTRGMRNLMEANIINPCILTTKTIHINDNMTYPYDPQPCWSLLSSHCSEAPSYAVFTRKNGGGLDLEAYIGGHKVEISAGGDVKVDGANFQVINKKEKIHKERGEEIFKFLKWGSTYTIYSSWKVMVIYDGTFVEVIPAPSVKGQHCGVCGNYDNNRKNDVIGKDGNPVAVKDLAKEWCL